MADKPQSQSQSPNPTPSPQSPTPQHSLPVVDPAKTINYRQDGIDRSKGRK
jgi:hypothetical protein